MSPPFHRALGLSCCRAIAWSAWGSSCATHLVILGALSMLVVSSPNRTAKDGMAPAWNEETSDAADVTTELPPPNTDRTVSETAGGASTGLFDPAAELLPASAAPPSIGDLTRSAPLGSAWSDLALHRSVTPLPTAKATGGAGHGTGTGVGDGDGPGFFGLKSSTGLKTVFVVDNSRSMNRAHPSPSRTRFRRVKLELLKCIAEMSPDQLFYVIFFSNETLPMPTSGYVSSAPRVRDAAMEWIGNTDTSGAPTDPREALDLALRMQPDVICFLTDGEFNDLINRRLRSLQQPRTAIHTFAIGDTFGEEVLKLFAEHNHGEYRFVP